MDGWIQIGTRLDNSKFDKDMQKLQAKIDEQENKKMTIQEEIVINQDELDNAKRNVEDLSKQYEEASNKAEKLNYIMKNAPAGSYESHVAGLEYTETVNEIDRLYKNLEKAEQKQSELNVKASKLSNNYNQANNRIKEMSNQMDIMKAKKVDFSGMTKSIESAGKGISNLILRVLSLGVAYSLVTRMSSNLASYDEEYSANLEYIRYVLTEAIAPVLKGIVELVATILGYIFQILNAWFGLNLGASADSFNKMKKATGGISKDLKEAKNQLAGFDEANVLQDNTQTSAGGGGVSTPSLDFGQGQDAPKWLKWLIDNKPLILSLLAGIVGYLTAIKLGLAPIKALGIGVAIAGIAYTIQQLVEYLNDPSWEKFGGIIQGIGVAVVGLGILIQSTPLIIAGAVTLIVATLIRYWNEIKNGIQKGIDWLTGKSDWVHEMFGDTIGEIYDLFVDGLKAIFNVVDSVFRMIKGVFDGFIQFFKGVFSGDWTIAWEGIKNVFKSIGEGLKGIAEGIVNFISSAFSRVWQVIVNLFGGIGQFFQGVWNTITRIFTNIGVRIGEAVSWAFKKAVNGVFTILENIVNAPIRAINGLLSVINAVPGINLGYLTPFSLPRLKVGGIINQPGMGINIGGAIAGESGREGVIPLTDSQAMETLGESIGKYITINALIENKMNGRIISRELQTIQNEKAFASNG